MTMGASEEELKERVVDDVVWSRQINRDSGREGGLRHSSSGLVATAEHHPWEYPLPIPLE